MWLYGWWVYWKCPNLLLIYICSCDQILFCLSTYLCYNEFTILFWCDNLLVIIIIICNFVLTPFWWWKDLMQISEYGCEYTLYVSIEISLADCMATRWSADSFSVTFLWLKNHPRNLWWLCDEDLTLKQCIWGIMEKESLALLFLAVFFS